MKPLSHNICNLKKVLTLVLTVAMLLSVMVVATGAAFSDQDQIKNKEAVDVCTTLNIIAGMEDGSYRPANNVTRAQMCKMICVALNGGKEPTLGTNASPTFSDVRTDPSSAWAESFIESCNSQGIVSGVGGGRFSPSGSVTGTQAARMLLVALGYRADQEGFTGDAWAINVNTLAYLARFIRTGMPLVSRTVTVDGSAVNTPCLVTAPIGTPVSDIFAAAGGFKEEPTKVLAGGPMMGIALESLDYPMLWQNGSFLALNAKDAKLPEPGACIRCGRCVDACPMNLMAFQITKAYRARDLETLKTIRADLCIECGCCAYVCPAKRDMVTSNKLAKRFMADEAKKEANK